MTEVSRAYTEEEVRQKFLDKLHQLSKYWATLETERSIQERCDGLVFSILNVFDGTTVDLPAMDISLSPHPDDKNFHKEEGTNWFKPKMVINDCMLHDLWYNPKPN